MSKLAKARGIKFMEQTKSFQHYLEQRLSEKEIAEIQQQAEQEYQAFLNSQQPSLSSKTNNPKKNR